MTVEADITTALTPLVAAGSVYPDIGPVNAPRPYITYQQAGGESVSFMERALPSKENARIQVSVYADTRAAAKALIKQVEAALAAATAFQATALGASIGTYEQDTKLYGSLQDFSVWSDR